MRLDPVNNTTSVVAREPVPYQDRVDGVDPPTDGPKCKGCQACFS